MYRIAAAVFLFWSTALFSQTTEEMQTIISVQQAKIKALEDSNKAITDRFNAVVDAQGKWIGSPTGLVGPRGPTGATGLTGATGPTGPAGPTFAGVIRVVTKYGHPTGPGPMLTGSCKDACSAGETCVGDSYAATFRSCLTEVSGPPAPHYCMCMKN